MAACFHTRHPYQGIHVTAPGISLAYLHDRTLSTATIQTTGCRNLDTQGLEEAKLHRTTGIPPSTELVTYLTHELPVIQDKFLPLKNCFLYLPEKKISKTIDNGFGNGFDFKTIHSTNAKDVYQVCREHKGHVFIERYRLKIKQKRQEKLGIKGRRKKKVE